MVEVEGICHLPLHSPTYSMAEAIASVVAEEALATSLALKEYKIVHTLGHSVAGNGEMRREVFSFRTSGVLSGTWRRIGDCPFSAWTDGYPVCVKLAIVIWMERQIDSLSQLAEPRIQQHFISHALIQHLVQLLGVGSWGLSVVGFYAEAMRMDSRVKR
ncbi:hypothetical protein C2S51_034198 [Perilla frutescens var. frutescens]|nr:hypothetical protein C2S51_034198 [Perilla frutescens var. frutescens]